MRHEGIEMSASAPPRIQTPFSPRLLLSLLGACLLVPSSSSAGVIDFESIPGVGTPSEGLVVHTHFAATEGVTFSLETGGAPVIADYGGNRTAFGGPPYSSGSDNTVESGLGAFLLTDDGVLGGLSAPPLVITYDPPTSAASGVILDIDFDETFTIEARDIGNTVLESITIEAGDPHTGDGVGTSWSFDHPSPDIYSIRFVGTRTSPGSFGLGFDNFNTRAPISVPSLTHGGRILLAGAIFVLALVGRALGAGGGSRVARGLRRRALSFLPRLVDVRRVRKHYLAPLSERRRQVNYDSQAYFESWYRATLDQEFSDRITISPTANPWYSRFHYNAVENGILESMVRLGLRPENPRTLDIGSGAGHWISFYLEVFRASQVVGLEISRACVDALRRKFADIPSVRVELGDVSSGEFDLGERFDVINAVGVMFHIVDDAAWLRALRNLRKHLNAGGALVVGGHFGLLTRNVQFHESDRFESWDELRAKRSDVALVNKRIRSRHMWRRGAREAGLKVRGFHRTQRSRGIWTPENNLLFLQADG